MFDHVQPRYAKGSMDSKSSKTSSTTTKSSNSSKRSTSTKSSTATKDTKTSKQSKSSNSTSSRSRTSSGSTDETGNWAWSLKLQLGCSDLTFSLLSLFTGDRSKDSGGVLPKAGNESDGEERRPVDKRPTPSPARQPSGKPPTPSPTCIECDDYPGDQKVDANVDTLIANIEVADPTAAPTCVECDDEPKPTRPLSLSLAEPEKKPTTLDATVPDTSFDIKTDGDFDPLEDSMLHTGAIKDDSSGSQSLGVSSLISVVWSIAFLSLTRMML